MAAGKRLIVTIQSTWDIARASSPHTAEVTKVLGVHISAVNLESATQRILEWIATSAREYVAVTGVHGVVEAQEDPALKKIFNEAGMTVPDGMPMVWISKRAGRTEVSRVFGPDLMLEVCARLSRPASRSVQHRPASVISHAT